VSNTDLHQRELFIYRTSAPASGHRFSVSAYLVERLAGSAVVARIEPLGLVPKSMIEHELRLIGLKRDLVIAGPWRATSSNHHAHVRVSPLVRAGASPSHGTR
jgi:hypothetical protein